MLTTLHSERFQDQAPRQVYAELLDEGMYLASPRTMYRSAAPDALWHGDVCVEDLGLSAGLGGVRNFVDCVRWAT